MKFSRQREAIKDFMMGRCDHPTADVVYTKVRELYPNISLGTVYRNLQQLTELGVLRKINVGDGVEHFDPNTSPHMHFLCSSCGSVQDVEMSEPSLDSMLKDNPHLGKIQGSVTYFYGICHNCVE